MFLVMEVKLLETRFSYNSDHQAEIVAEGDLKTLAVMPYGMSESLSSAAHNLILMAQEAEKTAEAVTVEE